MLRNVNTTNLTKEYIESKISQELIVSKYLDIPMEVVKDCIEHNTLITSVFRDNDSNGSMGIQYNVKGRLKVRDFGGFGFFEDVYGTVAYVLSLMYGRKIETNNKQDFYFVLKHIATTFSDIIDNKSVDDNVTDYIKGALKIAKQRKPIIEIAPRSWNKQDKEYWNHLGVSLGYLILILLFQLTNIILIEELTQTLNIITNLKTLVMLICLVKIVKEYNLLNCIFLKDLKRKDL